LPGTYASSQNVAIECTTSGATIYYTTDDKTPTSSSSIYSSPILIASTKTINAIAVKGGMANSALRTATYTISAPIVYPLNISKTGPGTGTVSSEPAGINCGSDCSESFDTGTILTLTATPASGSVFTGWSGAYNGTDNPYSLTMNEAKSISAEFILIDDFTISVPYDSDAVTGHIVSIPVSIKNDKCVGLQNIEITIEFYDYFVKAADAQLDPGILTNKNYKLQVVQPVKKMPLAYLSVRITP
jgi:hypothetical protein